MTRRTFAALVAIAAVVVALALVLAGGSKDPVGAAGPQPSGPPPPFSPASFWNAPLASDAKLAPNNTELVGELERQVGEYTPWINTTEHSTPVYVVPKGQARVRVHVDTPSALYTDAPGAALVASRLSSVPIPPDAHAAPDVNHHLVIWQPSTDTIWELWNAHLAERDGCPWHNEAIHGWHAAWGARISGASRATGINPFPTGATASGLPMIGGLIRLSEWRSGEIDHALALAIPDLERGSHVWPATRTDGDYTGPHAIPMGTRFRLDPSVDVDSLWLSPAGKMIARAAQRYGIVIRDHTDGAVTFYGEDPAPTGENPYPRFFGGQSPNEVLKGFPWDRLQVLAVP